MHIFTSIVYTFIRLQSIVFGFFWKKLLLIKKHILIRVSTHYFFDHIQSNTENITGYSYLCH